MNVPDSLFVGKNLIHFPELDSTNIFATDLVAKTNPSEGTAVISDFQTAGKGQIGRYWHSEAEKNLLVSYILYPKSLNVDHQFVLNIISGLAVYDVISAFMDHVKIKWPNDIYVRDKKIAGILVQNTLRGSLIKSCIIGIGLNINQSNWPPEIPNPTSIVLETSSESHIMDIFKQLSARLEYYYLMIRNRHFDLLVALYHDRLYQKDLWAWYQGVDEIPFEGMILGITNNGELQVQNRDGSQKSFSFRSIKFLHIE